MRRKKTKTDPDDPLASTHVAFHVVGGMRIETTVRTCTAEVDYDDILAACEVVDDDHNDAPWEDGDGWEHEVIDHPDEKSPWSENWHEVQKSEAVYCADRAWHLIVIDRKMLEGWQGEWEPGLEPRQAYEDRLAACRRRAIEQLVKWHTDGWRYYGVTCDFRGYDASLWGIQTADDDDDDPYLDEVKGEMADDVAGQLEEDGYVVVNRPEQLDTTEHNRRGNLRYFRQRMATRFGFKDYETYRAWVEDCDLFRAGVLAKITALLPPLDDDLLEILGL